MCSATLLYRVPRKEYRLASRAITPVRRSRLDCVARRKLISSPEQGHYLIFDCPGQVELYTHHKSMQNIVATFQKWNYRVRRPWSGLECCLTFSRSQLCI